MSDDCDLQISLSIGKQKYTLIVSPDNNLETVVSKFLLDNAINAKHKDTIISHVRQSLNQEAAAQLEKQTDQSQSVAKEFTMSPMIEQPPSAKEQILAKIKQYKELRETEDYTVPDSRQLYEGWKQKEKSKQRKRIRPQSTKVEQQNRNQQPKQLDYMYRKGLAFQQKCRAERQSKHKECYPFKIVDYSIDETAKQKLFDRLFKEHKVRDYASISQQGRHMLGTACVDKLPKATIDPVKEKVRAADAEVDLMLLELIRQCGASRRV